MCTLVFCASKGWYQRLHDICYTDICYRTLCDICYRTFAIRDICYARHLLYATFAIGQKFQKFRKIPKNKKIPKIPKNSENSKKFQKNPKKSEKIRKFPIANVAHSHLKIAYEKDDQSHLAFKIGPKHILPQAVDQGR